MILILLGSYVLHNATDLPRKVDCFNYMIDDKITPNKTFELGVSRGCLMVVEQTFSTENSKGFKKCVCNNIDDKPEIVRKSDTTVIDSSSTTTASKSSPNLATNPSTNPGTNPATNPAKNPEPKPPSPPADNQASSHFKTTDSMLTYVMISFPLLIKLNMLPP